MIVHFSIIQRGGKKTLCVSFRCDVNAESGPEALFLLKRYIKVIKDFANILCRRSFAFIAESSAVFCGLCYSLLLKVCFWDHIKNTLKSTFQI